MTTDETFMREALALAVRAESAGEVPVGAVVVLDGEIVGRGANAPLATADPSAHAEIIALRNAGAGLGNYRLNGSRLFVTLEPCLMCAGAMIHARIAEVVFAAHDPKTGALGGAGNALDAIPANHRFSVRGGLLADEAGALLRDFFRKRRKGAAG
ncbi:MAG: tRNA adenosine(34) deaminase TadA [Pseudomonadota bacterium]